MGQVRLVYWCGSRRVLTTTAARKLPELAPPLLPQSIGHSSHRASSPSPVGLKPQALVPQKGTVFGDRGFQEMLKAEGAHWGGLPRGWRLFMKGGNRVKSQHRGTTAEDPGTRQPPPSPGERPEDQPSPATPGSCPSCPCNREKINFCCVSHPGFGALL